jgi:hypothetical protein
MARNSSGDRTILANSSGRVAGYSKQNQRQSFE